MHSFKAPFANKLVGPVGPICRRCGRPVERVDSCLERDTETVVLEFHCHRAVERHRVSVSGLMRFRHNPNACWADVFPTHVFDYETLSFGAWDANGAPVEAA